MLNGISHRQLSSKASLKPSNQCSEKRTFTVDSTSANLTWNEFPCKSPGLSPGEGGLVYNSERGDLVVPFSG